MKLHEITSATSTGTGNFASVNSPFQNGSSKHSPNQTPFTSIQSVGNLEFDSKPHKVKLFKRNQQNEAECVACIERKTNNGWRFKTLPKWKEHNLPHFGQLENVKSPRRGKKTISDNLHQMLHDMGMKYDSVRPIQEKIDEK